MLLNFVAVIEMLSSLACNPCHLQTLRVLKTLRVLILKF